MKKTLIASLLTLITTSITTSAIAGGGTWTYEGKHGAKHWHKLNAKYATCGTGVNQSPINITDGIEALLPALEINYQASQTEVVNNGHTIQANLTGNNTFSSDAGHFGLLQLHFHSPSENTLNGQSFPLEAHFVHADKQGNLAVMSVMFEEGDKNKALDAIWAKMPKKAQDSKSLSKQFNPSDLLPISQDYYRFNGSLTTPPCSEGVRWFVLKQAVKASKKQITQFNNVMGGPTNRPTQPINARIIAK